ncbi:hypothetical protein CEUSTIGMA_g4896.t1 [Chlamydomonas eustigma]|uniref:ACT domain-containing protein n=1 Tax=Chlamydomonas eustigma TaxID=1157962 RepID=A0A250X3H1_9CHLO|nr:hypothetical protein CEUSTIGMA_g4896.t1 [Chlamydomonas eustigma]|eukprot:GAX77452.1 hypothetical protein CEUSTIGMA_g4896.t1 [Chlamydomonas eustigma]
MVSLNAYAGTSSSRSVIKYKPSNSSKLKRSTNTSVHVAIPERDNGILSVTESTAGSTLYRPAASYLSSSKAASSVVPSEVNARPQRSESLGTLLLSCPDQKGVIAAVAQLLFGFGCNVVSSDQFSELDTNMFFQRVVFDYSECIVGPGNTAVLERAISDLANRFNMTWKICYKNKMKRIAILVSKQDHCLYDLLIRFKSGEMPNLEIPVIISNHPDLEYIADKFDLEFKCLPITDKGQKQTQELEIEKLVESYNVDFIVLARYMQIFSADFCNRHWHHTINIHHSFLPAFEGARPYHRAHERGVKIIGATAHFATSELDAGPIIEQAITRITHRDSVEDMIRKGRDLERLVLSRAVRLHLEDRVMVHGNKTIVFED